MSRRDADFRWLRGDGGGGDRPPVDERVVLLLLHYHWLIENGYTHDEIVAELDSDRRREEFERAVRVLPVDHLEKVQERFDTRPAWHTLTEPAEWVEVPAPHDGTHIPAGTKAELALVLREWWRPYDERGAMPVLDSLRRKFGRKGTVKRTGEVPEQGTLPL
jgi:hypothetical protein